MTDGGVHAVKVTFLTVCAGDIADAWVGSNEVFEVAADSVGGMRRW